MVTDKIVSSPQGAPLLCGVDLGGTKIAIALVERNGHVRTQRQIRDHRNVPPREVVSSIAATVRELLATEGILLTDLPGIGVGTSGHVNYDRGIVITNSNLPGFDGFPLGDRLQGELGVPIYLDNDANAQAWAEYRFGAGQGFPDMAFITASTGVGAGLIVHGTVFRGVTGTAGEMGHAIVEPTSSIICGCGRPGCLMAYTSGLTLPQVVREMVACGPRLAGAAIFRDPSADAAPSSIDFTALQDREITGELIGEGLRGGDPFCRQVVEQYADYFAIGLNNLYQTINTAHFVVGGGLTGWGAPYLDRIRERFRILVKDQAASIPEIRLAQLGAEAAVVGAAALPLEQR